MNSSHGSPAAVELDPASGDDARRFSRLAATRALRGAALEQVRASNVAVIGAGMLGGRLACELARSGADVLVVDPQSSAIENLGNQIYTAVGRPKAELTAVDCNAVRPGSAEALTRDIRHVGVGVLRRMNLLVDCTDDPKLEWPLTELSNGLGVPLVRAAVDGSGERDAGRVQVSHGGAGGACRVCAKSAEDLMRQPARTPCPGVAPDGTPPTLAGNAIGCTVVGITVLQILRLLGGVDREQALDSHVLIDLDAGQLLWGRERRNEKCLSGHQQWSLQPIDLDARQATFAQLLDAAGLGPPGGADCLEVYGHALCQAAHCPSCGRRSAAVGTRWAAAGDCPDCGQALRWDLISQQRRWSRDAAQRAGILQRTAVELGLPDCGAMLVVRRPGKPAERLVLA